MSMLMAAVVVSLTPPTLARVSRSFRAVATLGCTIFSTGNTAILVFRGAGAGASAGGGAVAGFTADRVAHPAANPNNAASAKLRMMSLGDGAALGLADRTADHRMQCGSA